MSRWAVFLAILIGYALLQLSGCGTLISQIQPDAIVTTTISIEPVPADQIVAAADFNIVGRISIRDENQSFSGSFRWQHNAAGDEILLFSPLGQAVAEITRDHDGVRLITSKLEAFYAPDVERLTQEVLGWQLPLNGLQYWIQGIPSPVTAAEKDLDIRNQLVTIRQDGWQISYNDFASLLPNSMSLPRVMSLNYEKLRIRLAVDDWDAK